MRNRRYKSGNQTDNNELSLANVDLVLGETISLLKNSRNVDLEIVRKSDSFKLFKTNLKRFEEASLAKRNSVLKSILSYFELLILAVFLLCFLLYLTAFLRAYYSTDTNVQLEFYSAVDSAFKWLIAQWLYYNDFTDLTREECAVQLPDFFNSITRPIEDCSMCSHNLTRIERVRGISKEEFLHKYAYTGVPLIVTDAMRDWPAMRTFSFKFLKDTYLNKNKEEHKQSKNNDLNELTLFKKLGRMSKNRIKYKSKKDEKMTCQFFPYKTKFESLYDLFDRVETHEYSSGSNNWRNTRPWYVGWSNCNNHVSKVLRKHYHRPYFLPDDSEMSKLDWIFMGTPGYGASMHIDDVQHQSWQAQISGIKRWTFMPPAECLLKCPFSLQVDVYPGDVIIFDSNKWFHSTHILGEELSLTIGSEYD